MRTPSLYQRVRFPHLSTKPFVVRMERALLTKFLLLFCGDHLENISVWWDSRHSKTARPGTARFRAVDVSRAALPRCSDGYAIITRRARSKLHDGRSDAGARARLPHARDQLRLCLRATLKENGHDLRLFAGCRRFRRPAGLPDLRAAAARAVLSAFGSSRTF